MKHLAGVLVFALAGCAAMPPRPLVPPRELSAQPPPSIVFESSAADLLARADALVAAGDFTAALRAYDDILRRYPSGWLSERARRGHSTVTSMLAIQAEVDRLTRATMDRDADIARLRDEVDARHGELTRAAAALSAREAELTRLAGALSEQRLELERLAAELAARDTELARARQELASRQASLLRLTEESERLRTALEDLKRLELQLERRR